MCRDSYQIAVSVALYLLLSLSMFGHITQGRGNIFVIRLDGD